MVAASSGAGQAAADCQVRPTVSTCIDADTLWAHAGGGPFFAMSPWATTPAANLSVGVVATYFSRPIGLVVASPDPAGTAVYPIDDAFDATLAIALGITDRFEVAVEAPLTLLQGGAGLGAVTGTLDTFPRSAEKDIRFGLGFGFLQHPDRVAGWALAGRLEFAAPTASTGVFAGSRTVTLAPSVVGDRRVGPVDLAAEVGARLRGTDSIGSTAIGSQMLVAFGVAVDLVPRGELTLGAEGFVLPGLDGGGSLVAPAEWIGSVSSTPLLDGDFGFALGGGGPFGPSGTLTTPRFRFDFAVRYAPKGRAQKVERPSNPGPNEPRIEQR